MQSRKAAKEKKDREQELVAEHRTREKGLVRQGKKPFYLKRSEQKKQLLVDRFAEMKPSQVDKAVEKRRRKAAIKELGEIPTGRRAGEGK